VEKLVYINSSINTIKGSAVTPQDDDDFDEDSSMNDEDSSFACIDAA
jgi:hypothetical protein